MTKRRGSSLVEAAIVAGLLLLLVVGIVDMLQVLLLRHALADRVQAGARYAARRGLDSERIANVVLYNDPQPAAGARPFFGLSADQVLVERLDAGTASDAVRVSIRDVEVHAFSPFLHGRIAPQTIGAVLPVEAMGAVN